jgi:hypothetical protein
MQFDDLGRPRRTVAEAALQEQDTVYQLDFSKLPAFGAIAFVGRTGSGKTAGIFELAYQQRHEYDIVLVFCDSADDAMEYEKRFPHAFVFEGWKPEAVEALYEIQQANTRKRIWTTALIIIEDFGYKNGIWNSELMKRVHNNGRHARIGVRYSIQNPKTITPGMRQQLPWVMLAPEKSPKVREKLFEAFNPIFRTFADFERTMRNCTSNHRMMAMFMQQGPSDALCDNVFWFKPAFPYRMFSIPTPERVRASQAVRKFSKKWLRRVPGKAPVVTGRVVTSAVRGPAARAPATVQTLSTVRALTKMRAAAAKATAAARRKH